MQKYSYRKEKLSGNPEGRISSWAKYLCLMLLPLQGVPMAAGNRDFPNDIVLESHSVAQSKVTVRGTVVDEDGLTMPGVNVVLKGTSTGVITDLDGNFQIAVPDRGAVLTFSFMGYMSQDVKVDGRTDLKVVLKSDVMTLDDLVVVGYGVQKKKLVTGATTQVKGDDITKLNTVNALEALASQTPGVNIVSSSGMPGEGFKVAVRGLGTIGDSEPLYIIDGVTGGDINSLNPADIESIDILKDAASAAIYGSRAANGVVLITTKQGRVGKIDVSLDTYVGWQNVYKKPDLLNAQQYVEIINEAWANDGKALDWANLVPDWNRVQNGWAGTNWFDEALNENALIRNHSLNITGGNESSVFSIGLSNTSQEGIIGEPVTPKYDRTTVRINSEHVLFKKGNLEILKFGENVNFHAGSRNGIGIGNLDGNSIRRLMTAYPLFDVYDEGGNYTTAIPLESNRANPIGLMDYEDGQNETKYYGLHANAYLTIQPIKNLVFKSSFGVRFSQNNYRKFVPEYNLASDHFRNENQVTQTMTTRMNWMIENTLNYKFSVKRNNFDVLVGQSVENNSLGMTMSGTNRNSVFDDFEHAWLDNTQAVSADMTSLSGGPISPHKMASFFGRVNYDYNETYMLTAVVRADGSSNFKRGNRWGVFPSVSVGWVVTNEPFMESVRPVMDFFKLRASYGQNGNQSIDPFQYLATINFGAYYFFGTDKGQLTTGAYPDILPNEDVTWETSEQFDIGFDARFFDSRLGLTFDWYVKNTRDWLLQAPALSSYGAGAPYVNGGDVQNKGVELGLTWQDKVGDFSYGISYNISHNKNEVTKINNNDGIIYGSSNVLWRNCDEMYRAQVGYPIGYFYGYKTAGVFQNQAQIDVYQGAKYENTQPGDLIFVDVNQDGQITSDDRTMIGNPHPDVNMGLNLNFGYKGFDLNISAVAVLGNQIARSYRDVKDAPLDNYTTEIYGRWHGEGTSNRLPRLTSTASLNWQNVSDIYIEDGDYLRLSNFTIGYDFKHLFPNMVLEKARIYFAVQNLFTITGYSGLDPEVGYGDGKGWVSGIDIGSYPSPRTVMVGFNLNF